MFAGDDKREKILVLFTMCLALFVVQLDLTVVNVALPTLSRALGASIRGLQWIVDAYILAIAVLLLTGGILGDRYGRKRMFIIGLLIFTGASLMAGLATSTGQLIAFRAMQGVGGALLVPGTLSILTVTFPPQERAKAIGLWSSISAVGIILGAVVAGWMIEHLGWRSVFFLNVPVGVIGALITMRVVQESRAPHSRRLDGLGLALGTAALFAATYGLIEANEKGWGDPLIVGTFVAAGLFLLGFVGWERSRAEPLVPLALFRIPAFSAGNIVSFAFQLSLLSTFFFISLYLQNIRGYTPFGTGIRFMPMIVMFVLGAPLAGRLTQRNGPRWPLTAGFAIAGTGTAMMSRVGATTPYGLVALAMGIIGFGAGLTVTPMTAAVMNAAGKTRAGLAAGVNNTARQVGGLFGIAMLGTLHAIKLKGSLTEALIHLGVRGDQGSAILASAGRGHIDAALLNSVSHEQAAGIQRAFKSAFLDGFYFSILVVSAVLFCALAVANYWIPNGTQPDIDYEEAQLEPIMELVAVEGSE